MMKDVMKVHTFSLAITAKLQHAFESENVFGISFVNSETYTFSFCCIVMIRGLSRTKKCQMGGNVHAALHDYNHSDLVKLLEVYLCIVVMTLS